MGRCRENQWSQILLKVHSDKDERQKARVIDHDKTQVDTREKILHHNNGQTLKLFFQRGSDIFIIEDPVLDRPLAI